MLPWRLGALTLGTLVVLSYGPVARADVPGALPPVSPCKYEGFAPNVCQDLPTDTGVCVSVTETKDAALPAALEKDGFRKRCAGEYHHAVGPYRHQTCEHYTVEMWCRDTRPEGFTSGHANACDVESYDGCQPMQRVASTNTRVVEKTCIDRAASLRTDLYRQTWERCTPIWQANGLPLPAVQTPAQVGEDPGVATPAAPPAPVNVPAVDRTPGAEAGCGGCTAHDGPPAVPALLASVGLLLARRRRAARPFAWGRARELVELGAASDGADARDPKRHRHLEHVESSSPCPVRIRGRAPVARADRARAVSSPGDRDTVPGW